MTTRTSGNNPHIVISTKDLQDPKLLEDMFIKDKSVIDYVITVEYGTNKHAHIESFHTREKPIRQDKMKEKIVKLYGLTDYLSKINTKVVFNTIDPNPLYGIGYAMKESPSIVLTNIPKNVLEEGLTYWNEHQSEVLKQKAILKEKYKTKQITIDTIADEYLDYCIMRDAKFSHYHDYFNDFMVVCKDFIPFSVYQKITIHKLNEWIEQMMKRQKWHGSLDCAPPQSP